MAKGVIASGPFTRGVVGPRVITPESLPGLELYLLSTDVAGGNGTPVATWPDRSGNARDATQATAGNRPVVLEPGSPNGTKLIAFTAGSGIPPASWMGGSGGPMVNDTNGFSCYCWANFKAGNAAFGFGNALHLTGFLRWALAWRLGTAVGAPAIDNRRGYRDQQSVSEGTVVAGAHSFDPQVSFTGMLAVVTYPPDSQPDPVGAPLGGPGVLYANGASKVQNVSPVTWRGAAGPTAVGYTINAGDQFGANNGEEDIGAVLWYSRAHDPATVAALTAYFDRLFRV